MNKLVGLAAAVALSLGSVTAAQATGLTFSVGQSGDSTMVYRLGAQFDFNSRWFESSVGHLGGYWDAGYTYWQGDDTSTNHSVSFAPVFGLRVRRANRQTLPGGGYRGSGILQYQARVQ